MNQETAVGEKEIAPLQEVYNSLGRVYLEPPKEELMLQIHDWVLALQESQHERDKQLNATLEKIRTGEVTDVEELQIAYTRLFRGISDIRSPKPPYESVYREGTIHGAVTNEVREVYRSVGLEVDDTQEPADHLGIELQFVGKMHAWENGKAPEKIQDPETIPQKRVEFLEEHLLQWFPDFKAACLEKNPPAFYEGWIELTELVMRDETFISQI